MTITVQNLLGNALSGMLLAVAYSSSGQQFEVRTMNYGLMSEAEKKVSVSMTTEYDEIGFVKAFLLDPSKGFVPECPSLVIEK